MRHKSQQRMGECVYCGEHKPLTDDHIPPKNLFAKPRLSDLITVPSCFDCNSGFQKDDEYFRTVLALWQETGKHPEAKRLGELVVRDLKRPEKFRFRRSILEKARPISLFTKSGLYAGETGVFEVDVLRLHQTVTRIVKGLFYYHWRYRLADSYEVQVRVSAADSQTVNLIKSTLPQLSVTPEVRANGAFKYWFELSPNDKMVSVWILLFFEYLPFMCATVPKGFAGDPKELFGILTPLRFQPVARRAQVRGQGDMAVSELGQAHRQRCTAVHLELLREWNRQTEVKARDEVKGIVYLSSSQVAPCPLQLPPDLPASDAGIGFSRDAGGGSAVSRYRRTEYIPGPMERLRAMMQGIGQNVFDRKEWAPSTGEWLWLSEIRYDHTLPTVGEWSVFIVHEITASDMTYEWHAADAWIEAYEQPNGYVRLEFIDGYSRISFGLGCNPIGRAFEEFAEFVVKEASRRDDYSHYETGLDQLRNRVKQDHPRHSEFLVYQQRLTENIGKSRRYGDTEVRKAERSEIIDRLNELSLSVLKIPFNDLCGLGT